MPASLWERILGNVAIFQPHDHAADKPEQAEPPQDSSKPITSEAAPAEIVGRGDELHTFDAYLERAKRGQGSLLVFSGAEGSGKTYLLKKLRERAGKAGVPAYYGRTGSSAASDPYQPIFNALGLGFDSQGHIIQVSLVTKTTDAWAIDTLKVAIDITRDILSLAPVVGQVVSVGTLVTKIGKYVYQNRQRSQTEGGMGTNPTFEALRRRLGDMMSAGRGTSHPLVLLLDDLHLAGETTFRLLDYILAADWPLLIVTTWNGEQSKLPMLMSDTIARVSGQVVPLRPLSADEAQQLAVWLAEHSEFSPAIHKVISDNATTLAALSAGQVAVVVAGVEYLAQGRDPALLTQLLKGGGEERVAAGGTGGAALLHSLAGQQIEQLDPLAQDLLSCGALIGDTFPLRVLTRANMLSYLGLSERAALRILLAQAEGRRLLAEDSTTPDQLGFTSAVTRQLLLRRVPTTLAKRDHRIIAAAWQEAIKRPGPAGVSADSGPITPEEEAARELAVLGHAEAEDQAPAETLQIAQHFEAAGDPLLALFYARQCGRTLLERRAYPEALAAFDAALGNLDALPPAAGPNVASLRAAEQVKLILAAAYVQEANSQLDDSQQRLDAALKIAEAANMRAEQADTLAQKGWICFKRDDLDDARGFFDRAYALYEEMQDAEGMARVDYYRGSLYSQAREYEQAVAAFERCLATSQRAGLADTDFDLVLLELGQVYIRLRRYDEAGEFIDRGLALAVKQGDEFARALGLRYRGRLWLDQRKIEALDTLREAQLIARDTLKDAYLESTVLNTLALALERFNKMDEARAAYLEALPILERTGNNYGLGAAYGGLGRLALNRGRYDEAADFLRRDLALVLRAPDPSPLLVSQLLTALAHAARGAGDADKSAQTIAQSIEAAEHVPDASARDETLGYAHMEAGWQALAAARQDDAVTHLSSAAAALKSSAPAQPELNLLHAAVAAAAGQFKEAGVALRTNLQTLQQMPQGASDLNLAALTCLQIAEVSLLEPTDLVDADARPCAARALDLATSLGNEELIKRAQGVLEKLPEEMVAVEA